MVHTLEHGAVWIAYNPKTIAAGDLDKLKAIVTGQSYLFMSPYPGLDAPISLQSWGHQLKLTSAGDVRIKQFIAALRQNPYTTPESGASCSQPGFAAAPPAFVATPPGSDAIQMDGAGLAAATDETVPNAATAASGAVPSGAAASGAQGSQSAATSAHSSGAPTKTSTASASTSTSK
jgi:hypothetical protein